jgi:hypothetical protein
MRLAAVLGLLFSAACAAGSSQGPVGSTPAAELLAPEAGAAAVAEANAIVTTIPDASDDGVTQSVAAASSTDAGASADTATSESIQIAMSDESPYAPGTRRRPGGAVAASHDDDVTARWNRGGPDASGTAAVKPPHPAPRVKVDVVQVRGHIEEAGVLRTARDKGYWPFRLCYEDGLRGAPKLHGIVRFRVTLGPGGTPRAVRKVSAEMDDVQVTSCVLKAARSLALAAPERGTPEVTLEVSFWPGDAPVRSASSPRATDAPDALVAALRSRWPAVRACYAEGLRRTPGLWGRLAMRLRVTSAGKVIEAAETESHFPDHDVTECALRVYERAGLSPFGGEDRVIVYPLRFGTPPG